MTAAWPRIPYGEASFRRIRVNGWLYVDKTRYLRPLEDERYVFFIRPRRFGKSCWLSLLECYYGRHWAHEFEALFGGTDIGNAPTAERGRYVVVRFDFSAFDDTLETLRERFEGYCHTKLRYALERHPDLFPEAALRRILAPPPSTADSLNCSHTPESTASRSTCSSTSTTTSPTRCSSTGGGRRTSPSPTAAASTATSSPP